MARSLNKVQLIGNLTRDPNLRYTGNSTAVCSFGIATNRSWSSDGDKNEQVEYHNIVAWSKLAEICGDLLGKGDQVYVEGRLQTRDWESDDGQQRKTTEIVINEMILLQSRSGRAGDDSSNSSSGSSKKRSKKSSSDDVAADDDLGDVEDIADDIPF